MSLRCDKYVWAVRLTKTRSIATELISKGKIKINGLVTKPSKEIKVGDVISISKNAAVFSFKVVQLLDKRVGAKLVVEYLLDCTPAEEIEKYRSYQLAQQSYRDNGSGKPSKKDRRDLDEFLSDWED
jgi:ribosome-associated heat shock protein Hsp15